MKNARKNKVESARKENCKKWKLQGMEFARKPLLPAMVTVNHMVNVSYLKINVQTFDNISEFLKCLNHFVI